MSKRQNGSGYHAPTLTTSVALYNMTSSRNEVLNVEKIWSKSKTVTAIITAPVLTCTIDIGDSRSKPTTNADQRKTGFHQ